AGSALQVEAGDFRGAHAEEREAAFVAAVDQLTARRRRVRENAEPRVGILAFENGKCRRREAGAADAVKAVAARNEVAADRVGFSAIREGDSGRRVLEIVDRDAGGFKE